jgi:tetratricopeptide (TPR) repeat protein
MNVVLGNQFYHARQYDRAIRQHLNTLEMNSNNWHAHWSLGMAYSKKGMYHESITEINKAISLSGKSTFTKAMLAYTYALDDRKEDAIKILNELMKQSEQRYVSPYAIAQIYAGLGDNDLAFKWLEKGIQEHSAVMAWIKVDVQLDSLRSDHRFTELLKKMDLEK